MDRLFATVGALSAFVALAAGAFGAHGLRARLSSSMLDVFETAARYQMYHALALLAAAWLWAQRRSGAVVLAGWLFLTGTVLFCGSLYLLALTGRHWLGAITPVGGMAFLAGWCAFAWGAWSRGSQTLHRHKGAPNP